MGMNSWGESPVKSREIVYLFFEAFGVFVLPVLEGLHRREMPQSFLRDLVIIEPNVAGEGIGQGL
jgi:hypothetical protein